MAWSSFYDIANISRGGLGLFTDEAGDVSPHFSNNHFTHKTSVMIANNLIVSVRVCS